MQNQWRMLYQGSDVWLNNPIRPLEACGTSGEKATLNGALNLSVLDGWWDEFYLPASSGAPSNGWAIPSAESANDHERYRIEAAALFDLLEREVVPQFYDRPDASIPRRWVFRMKHSLATLGHGVMASRMVKDYTTRLYEPAARRSDALPSDGLASELAAWKKLARAEWSGVKIVSVDGDGPRSSRSACVDRCRPRSRRARSAPTTSMCSLYTAISASTTRSRTQWPNR